MLNTHSKYSLKYGLKSPEDIVEWGLSNGYPRLVLTDINNTGGILSFVQAAKKNDFQPVAGVDIRKDNKQLYILIAQNNRGFHELNSFLSRHLSNQSFPEKAPFLPNCYVVYPLRNAPECLTTNERIGISLSQLENIEIQRHKAYQDMVLLHTMTFSCKRDFNVHRLLRAIDKNRLLSKLSTEDIGNVRDQFITKSELKNKLSNFSHLLENTEELLKSCRIDFLFDDEAEPQNISSYTGSLKEDRKKIEFLCQQGMKKRYKYSTPVIQKRIEREINTIEQKGYLAYFLVTWDIVSFAKSKQYPHVGRGSGANSIVAYLLGITDVDPLELDLYFERFINLYRKNPPDFDIDFSWTHRDEILDYVFERYPSATLLCTYNTFQYRATIRELGKVFGLPKDDIDKIIKQGWIAENKETCKLVKKYSELIVGLPNHLSVHAGGIIIPEKPVTWFSAYFVPPKGYRTTQFSMLEAEDVGLYKFDVLSQRGLSKIHDAKKYISFRDSQAELPNLENLNEYKEDALIKKMLVSGEAMGCFYVESPAMRMLMKKLAVSNYIELVAASSIIRPGVSSSGMMQEYILRHKKSEKRTKPHPKLLEIMPETYGVMVYQEDVIKVAHHFAGLSLDEADILRRGMSGKYRSKSEFKGVKERFFQNCKRKGYDKKITTEVWNQIESFAGYAFSKGHSASYAVESFQSLYLKAHHPLEYMLAVINNGGGYYRAEIYLREAQRLGAEIQAPDIFKSKWECVLLENKIYIGFGFIQGVELKTYQNLVRHRNTIKKIGSIVDFLKQSGISHEQAILLIRINAFRSLNKPRKELLWNAQLFFNKQKTEPKEQDLFQCSHKSYDLPVLEENDLEQSFEELELLGFSICSPFEFIKEPQKKDVLSSKMSICKGKKVVMYGYLISSKPTSTSSGERMFFGHFYDREGGRFDTVHFPNSVKKFPFRGLGVYELTGKITEEFGFFTLEVEKMSKVVLKNDSRFSE